jgi:hypothetical protein
MDAEPIPQIQVERLGGLAGFGGLRSRLRSRGTLRSDELSAQDRQILEQLFRAPDLHPPSQERDGFRYRLTRPTPAGPQSIEVPEGQVPESLRRCVRDEIL